ncbi:MAG: HAD hydrolase-like protein [Treponema sp.]|nr:HAD hydrolase-like protein [Treponema sp.]
MTNNSLSDNSLVLAIDIGTTSLKAAFVSAAGEVFSFKRIEYNSLSLSGSTRQSFDEKDSRVKRGNDRARESASESFPCHNAAARRNDTVGAAAWSKAVQSFLPSPLLSDCAAVSISGNGPTIVSQDGTTLPWNFVQKKDRRVKRGDDTDAADLCHCRARPDNLFSKIDIPDAQKKIYEPRLAAFKEIFAREWQQSARLFTSTQWLCDWIKKNAADLGLAPDIPVIEAGPDFVAALVGTATLFPGRLCDRAGSSEGLNLCSPKFFEAENLRVMSSPAKGLWNVSYLIADPGSSQQEKLDNFLKAYKTLTQAAAANGVDVAGQIMVTGGQAFDQDLLQKKADLTGTKIAVAQITDAELLGCAAAAFFRLGKYSSLEEAASKIVREGNVFLPGGASQACDSSQSGESFPRFYSVPQDLRAIIFDIDSTLYTNAAYAFEQVDCQVRRFASERGITNDEARKMVADYRKKFARENGGKKVSLSNTLFSFGISIEQSVQWRRELIEPADFLGPDKDLQEALAALSARCKLLCVTNNPILPAQKTLSALGIEKWIEVLVGLDSCNLSKPAKEPFVLAAKKAGTDPANIISVGDRYDLDIAPALELGMGGVLVRGVADVYRLPDLLS